jgi:hypothetical protein
MDFQTLFKRKDEGPAPVNANDNTRDSLNQKDVLVREGELLDGQLAPALVWTNVGGLISIKADKILGILEGRTRIRAATLKELYPGLFEKTPNPGAEYNIPLQVVVMQLKDIFAGRFSEETAVEDFDTPFGQLAREDEARFKDRLVRRPEVRPMATSKLFVPPELGSKTASKEGDQSTGEEQLSGNASIQELKEENPSSGRNTDSDELRLNEEKCTVKESSATPATFYEEIGENAKVCSSDRTRRGPDGCTSRPEQPEAPSEEVYSELERRNVASGNSRASSYARTSRKDNIRREGHVCLQELYLTDEPLDGSRVADLVLQLPRVTGVFIMLSHGAALGGGLSGGISETLLSLTPDFVRHLLAFTQSIQGGPMKFVTFSVQAGQISLSIGGNVLILAEHEGKSLPPGLRERLVATAQALDKIYSSQS